MIGVRDAIRRNVNFCNNSQGGGRKLSVLLSRCLNYTTTTQLQRTTNTKMSTYRPQDISPCLLPPLSKVSIILSTIIHSSSPLLSRRNVKAKNKECPSSTPRQPYPCLLGITTYHVRFFRRQEIWIAHRNTTAHGKRYNSHLSHTLSSILIKLVITITSMTRSNYHILLLKCRYNLCLRTVPSATSITW